MVGIITVIGMIMDVIQVATKAVKTYKAVIDLARSEGRDVSQEELDQLRSDRKKVVNDFLKDD